MTVLDSIIEGVREDLAARRVSMSELLEGVSSAPPVRDALAALRSTDLAIIAEVKRSSPSKGALAAIADPAALARRYQEAGAQVISVLTEKRRFHGSLSDLVSVRTEVLLPVLRKDFMVDEYQIYEARAYGADMVLLIVAALSKGQLKDYYDLSRELGMSVLVEVHTMDELDDAMEISPLIVGVNSRNLKTLDVDPSVFAEIVPRIPTDILAVAESGIATRSDADFARRHGARALLIGEALVRSQDPAQAIRELRG